jgi:hypothetical protein
MQIIRVGLGGGGCQRVDVQCVCGGGCQRVDVQCAVLAGGGPAQDTSMEGGWCSHVAGALQAAGMKCGPW